MKQIFLSALARVLLGALGCGAPRSIAECPAHDGASIDASCERCKTDCQLQQYGLSLQRRFQQQGGLLNVGLRSKHSVEEMRALLAPIGGKIECLDTLEFSPRLAGQSCYVIRIPTDRCYSDARQLVIQSVPDVASVEMTVPDEPCTCSNFSESLKGAVTPTRCP